jgi:RNA polymerase sigma-70 factor (ECF subfamily)
MPRDLQSDRDLAERAKQGDEASWRALYEGTCDRLFAFLCYQMGDRDEARDVLQETYIQAFRRLETYRGEAPLEVWLRSIAFGRSVDWKRLILRRFKRTAALTESSALVEPDIQQVHFDSEHSALYRALQQLSPRQRASLLLREWESRSFKEIGQLLGCNESTARVHHARAREHMREFLRGEPHLVPRRDCEGQET